VPELRGVRFVRVACGSHTLALADNGLLYSWGHGEHGQLGHGHRETEDAPRQVATLSGERVVGIAAGVHHSLALTDRDDIFTWGDTPANGTTQPRLFPIKLTALCGRGLAFAACGAAHTILIVAPGAGRHGEER
jgi:alpha-tubulin suppressor-like RCC1 family protein